MERIAEREVLGYSQSALSGIIIFLVKPGFEATSSNLRDIGTHTVFPFPHSMAVGLHCSDPLSPLALSLFPPFRRSRQRRRRFDAIMKSVEASDKVTADFCISALDPPEVRPFYFPRQLEYSCVDCGEPMPIQISRH